MRILLATVFVAGCSFDHGKLVDEDPGLGDPGLDDPTVDAGTTSTPRTCKYPDAELRLCIEFDDKVFSPMATDASPYQLDASASQIAEATRNGVPAAQISRQSSLVVSETAMLDIRPAITFEAWLQLPTYQSATLIGNTGQYALTIDTSGRATCWIGNLTATSQALGTNTWRHLACSFDGAVLRIHVDGAVQRCQNRTQDIPTAGSQGTRLAASFVGAIDDVRIYARALLSTEICSHADKTSCASSCPSSSGPGGGDD